MATPESRLKACHNCRRQRRKCDQSVPKCLKCAKRGQECLGYQPLLRWGQGLASRGKLRGMTFESLREDKKQPTGQPSGLRDFVRFGGQQGPISHVQFHPCNVLTDPLVQDLDQTSRMFLSYFASNTCPDFVLYDVPHSNPLRELIPLTRHYPSLLQIVIANSALHISNASDKFLTARLPSSGCPSSLDLLDSRLPILALMAKQQALALLNSALSTMTLQDMDIMLAIVLLFVQCELMDSGKTDWKHHIRGARSLIKTVYGSGNVSKATVSTLRRYLISNCLIYDVFGSILSSSRDLVPGDIISNGALSLLQDAEGNHCSSFPVTLLQILQHGAHLFQSSPQNPIANIKRQEHAHSLLQSAKAFDPVTWATNMQARSPTSDLGLRIHIASAHQSATCIYLSRIVLSYGPSAQTSENLEASIAQVQTQLSMISPSNPLFAATAWPSFIAGAEAKDMAGEKWARQQFQTIWEIQPWGLIKGALAVLEMIWTRRKRNRSNEDPKLLVGTGNVREDWIGYIKEVGVDWLIL